MEVREMEQTKKRIIMLIHRINLKKIRKLVKVRMMKMTVMITWMTH